MNLSLKIKEKKFGEKVIFENFAYEFEECGIYAIVGESGKGKTTLLRIIAGLEKKYDGEVLGGGFSNVSFVFQEYRLFPALSAIENITEATGVPYDVAKSALNKFGFTDDEINLFPAELSGGMKQRVSLLRAIFKNTPILLLDEPTKELDSELKIVFFEMLNEVSKSRLVIFVSHIKEDLLALQPTIISI